MTKYYRVRTQEQWDWLNNKLKEHHKCHSTCPYDELLATRHGHVTDTTCGVIVNNSGLIEWGHYQELGIIHCVSTSDFIEVSDLMEDEKMENEDYVTIKGKDLEKIHWETNYGHTSFINHDENGEKYAHEQYFPADIIIPKSLVQQKVKMTEAEKKEFDKLKDEMSLDRHDLDDLLTRIKDSEDFPSLYHCLYVADGDGVENQLEFARAWADPSLIEVLPEPRWNVKVCKLEHEEMFYFKQYGGTLGWGAEPDDDDPDCQFTVAELKHYGLDGELFEKVEVEG